MNWFFWIITLAMIAAFGMAIKPCKNNFIRASRNLRFIFVYLVYAIYYIASRFDPAGFNLADGSNENLIAFTFVFLMGPLLATVCMESYLSKRPQNPAQQKELSDQLKKLEWCQAVFDREAFAEERRALLRESKNLFFRRKM
jgi:hypothetical protein